jgi:hypothetical protein
MDPVSGLPPILEFDDGETILEPSSTQARLNVPASAVACFFTGLLDEMLATHVNVQVQNLPSMRSIHVIQWNGQCLALFYPGMGSGLWAVVRDRVIVMGCT